LPGVVWIARRRVQSSAEDYDDRMALSRKCDNGPVNLESLAATEEFGRRLGTLLFPNSVIALIGPLGAGKTHLSRAIAEGLGISNPAAVTSPTFTLIHEYPARLPIFHFDAYRLKGPNEFLDLGATEYFEAGGVCLIEWADRVASAVPDERLTIHLEATGEQTRRATLSASGVAYQNLLKSLQDLPPD
jgi:tRNA threonylcarbamoyladenosine biosynthesis protein TsaE